MNLALRIVVSFVVVAVTAGFIFLLFFDVDRYRPEIESALSAAAGNPVRIGKLSLLWKGTTVIRAERVGIFDSQAKVLSVEKIDAAVSFIPLLKHEIVVSSVVVERPEIQIIKTADGAVSIRGIGPAPGKKAAYAAAQKKEMPGGAVRSFAISALRVNDGTIRYRDETIFPLLDSNIRKFDLSIKDVSSSSVMRFDSKMAVFSEEENVTVSGSVSGLLTGSPRLKGCALRVDLSKMDYAICAREARIVKACGITGGFNGDLSVDLEEPSRGSFKLSGGEALVMGTEVPLRNISISGDFEGDSVNVKSFSLEALNAAIRGEAKIKGLSKTPVIGVKTEINIDRLKPFLSGLSGARCDIDGDFALFFNGTGTGRTAEDVLATLSGKGMYTLDNGVILGVNLLEESFDKLSSLSPGLADNVKKNLPASLAKALNDNYTVLQPIQQPFSMNGGVMRLDPLSVSTEYMEIDAQAEARLTGRLWGEGTIKVSRPLSRAVIGASSLLQALANVNGQIEIPVDFSVDINRGVSISPDTKYIGSKLAAAGQGMVSGLLQGVGGGANGAANASGSGLQNILGQLGASQQ
jgi:hypothetical protein